MGGVAVTEALDTIKKGVHIMVSINNILIVLGCEILYDQQSLGDRQFH